MEPLAYTQSSEQKDQGNLSQELQEIKQAIINDDVSNLTRYDIKDGKLYDIIDPNNEEVPHKWGIQVIKDQEKVYVEPTIN